MKHLLIRSVFVFTDVPYIFFVHTKATYFDFENILPLVVSLFKRTIGHVCCSILIELDLLLKNFTLKRHPEAEDDYNLRFFLLVRDRERKRTKLSLRVDEQRTIIAVRTRIKVD